VVSSGGDLSGVWSPHGPYEGALGPVPDGQQVGYSNSCTVDQTLADTLQANTTYTLRIDVGGRTDVRSVPANYDYTVELLGGIDVLAAVTTIFPPVGSWTTLTALYTTPNVVPPGIFLGILISRSGSSQNQLNFDNVRLDAAPISSVPDGGNLMWLWALSLVGLSALAKTDKRATR
jgi:hypothetical protein